MKTLAQQKRMVEIEKYLQICKVQMKQVSGKNRQKLSDMFEKLSIELKELQSL